MSSYADEGTVAHALAAMTLREEKDCAAYIGRIIECEDYEHSVLGPSKADQWMVCTGSAKMQRLTDGPFTPRKFSMEVTAEMAEDVQVYVDNLRRYAQGGVLLVEQSLDLSHVLGEKQGGQGDGVVFFPNELQVHDLKFGRGVEVSAVDNRQMQLYGIGALVLAVLSQDYDDNTPVRLVIHQPRIKREPSEWLTTVGELRKFAAEAQVQARRAMELVQTPTITANELHALNMLKTSTKGCRFCSAKAECPATVAEVGQTVFDHFEVLGNPHETAQPRLLPAGPSKLAAYMAKVDAIEDWCTAVRKKVFEQLNAGVPVPGFKLVQGKKGNRQWTSEDTVIAELEKSRLKQDEMYDKKLKSPTTLEKDLKTERPKVWAKLMPLITQKDGAPHVAPADDARPALKAAADYFDIAS